MHNLLVRRVLSIQHNTSEHIRTHHITSHHITSQQSFLVFRHLLLTFFYLSPCCFPLPLSCSSLPLSAGQQTNPCCRCRLPLPLAPPLVIVFQSLHTASTLRLAHLNLCAGDVLANARRTPLRVCRLNDLACLSLSAMCCVMIIGASAVLTWRYLL